MERDGHEDDDVVKWKQPASAMPIKSREVRQPIDRSLFCAIGKVQNESRENKEDIYAQEAVLHDNGKEAVRIKLAGK